MPANAIDPAHSEETRKYVLKNLAQYLFHLSRTIQHPDRISIERGGTYPDREPLKSAAIAIGNLHHDTVQALNTLLLVRQLPDHIQTRKAVNILARLGDGWQAAIASAQLSIDMGDDDAAIKICEDAVSEARVKFANTIESIGGKLAASAAFGLPGTPTSTAETPQRPAWNKETGELSFDGAVVKRVRNLGSAGNVLVVLGCFEEAKWPNRIDDPLPFERVLTVAKKRLNETVRSLNGRLSTICFSSGGDGESICWAIKTREPD